MPETSSICLRRCHFHFWSLAVEEQFYLIWPFLLIVQKTRGRAKLLCLITFVLSWVFRITLWHIAADPASYWQFLLSRAGELAAGGWLALAFRGELTEWRRVVRLAPYCALLGFIGFLAAGLYAHGLELQTSSLMQWGLPCITLFFAALLVLAIEPGLVSRLAHAAWLRWIGAISYGVYVFHVLLGPAFHGVTMLLVGRRGPMVQNGVNLVVAVVGTVAAALLSSKYFEQPLLRLKSRYAPATIRAVAPTASLPLV